MAVRMTMIVVGADAHHMVMMASLHRAHLALVAQHLLAVFAQLAVHGRIAVHQLGQAIDEGVDDQGMVAQIGGFEEFDAGIFGGGFVGPVIDALDQDAGEQEVGENDDALEAQLHGAFQARIHQRRGDAGIGDLGPAEAHAFPQHAGDLGDIGIGVGIVGAAPHHHQQGLGALHLGFSGGFGFFDTLGGSAQKLQVHRQLAAIFDLKLGVFAGVAVDFPRQIVLHMAGGEQHGRQGENAGGAPIFQLV